MKIQQYKLFKIKHRENRIEKMKSISGMRDNLEQSNIRVFGFPIKGEGNWKIFEEIMAETIPNLWTVQTHRSKQSNEPQAQETWRKIPEDVS